MKRGRRSFSETMPAPGAAPARLKLHVVENAYEIISYGDAAWLLTCEHASERFPKGFALPPPDIRLAGTHWAYDIGAADLTRELAEASGSTAVLSRFSRLIVDANREPSDDTLFRAHAEGHPVALNAALTVEEKRGRMEQLYEPYHRALGNAVQGSECALVLAIHTFTPVYEGARRNVEVGVLFDREEALAERFADALRTLGFVVGMNEPYSGRDGLMHAVVRHATPAKRRALELEVRQDFAADSLQRRRICDALISLLPTFL